MNELKVQREVLANTGGQIDIGGVNPKNDALYNAAYDQFLKDDDAIKAQQAIAQIFGDNERISGPINGVHPTHNEYYGGWYDKHIAPKVAPND